MSNSSARPLIESVGDTALWVAGYRALEAERADAIVRDPFAQLLVGERGRELARRMPDARSTAWAIPVRTRAIDELILGAVRDRGIDTVLNLGAGLDARPYRLPLPAGLRWIELDQPSIVDYKEAKLAGRTPACRVERHAIDLADTAARDALFRRINDQSQTVLVVSEGVIPYLTAAEVESLARALHEQARFRFWIQDFSSNFVLRHVRRRWKGQLGQAAPFKFFPEARDGLAFFEALGWRPAKVRYAMEEGIRLGRAMPLMSLWRVMRPLVPAERREQVRTMSGYAMLERSAAAAATNEERTMATTMGNAEGGSVQAIVEDEPRLRRLRLGVKALLTISENPHDYNKAQLFSLYINGGAYPQLCQRFADHPDGKRLLRERPYLDAATIDFDALAKLPPSTLGYEFAQMIRSKNLKPFGRPTQVLTVTEYVAMRSIQAHDIQHVVLGYGTDTLGELELQAFLYAQQRLPGHLLASALGGPYVSLQPWFGGTHRDPFDGALASRAHVVRRFRAFSKRWMAAYERGRAARFIVPVLWEEHWSTPLTTLRERLRLGPPPRPFTSAA
jgi:methyltransferase (TIGR00027 family)